MRSQFLIAACACIAGSLVWAVTPSSPPAESIATPRTTSLNQFFGNAGCAATGCHNAMERPGTPGSEYSTWSAGDPHAKAYGVLFRPDAVRMERLYRKLPNSTAAAAHNDELCLKCHSPMGVANKDLRNDAVGCEACHGASSQWRTTHYLREWKTLDIHAKVDRGLNNTKDLIQRVNMCAQCHVGAPGMEVDHDLIAAGHPRLFFDYAAYHDLLPRHWKEPDEASFSAKAWAIGRLASAHAAMNLLIERTTDQRRWPELSEFNCYSCHRGLTGNVQAKVQPGKPIGSLGANSWNLAMLNHLGIETEALNRALHGLASSPAAIREAAEQLRGALENNLKSLDLATFNQPWATDMERKLLGDAANIRDWDQATQHYLALSAMQRAQGNRGTGLNLLRDTLRFEPGRSSPTHFSLDKYLRALADFKAVLPPPGGSVGQ